MAIRIEHQLVPYTGKSHGAEKAPGSVISDIGTRDLRAGHVKPVLVTPDFSHFLHGGNGTLLCYGSVYRRCHTPSPQKGSIIDVFA